MQLWIIRILKVWVDLHIWMCDPVLFPVTSIDVNECVEISDICGPNSICNNTVGSYNCSCMSGYNVTDPNLPITAVTHAKVWVTAETMNSVLLFVLHESPFNYYLSVYQLFYFRYSWMSWISISVWAKLSLLQLQWKLLMLLLGGFNVSDGNTAISKGNPCTGQFLFIWYSASVWKSFSTFGYCKMYKYIYFITILPIRIQIIVIIILLEMLTFQPNLYTFWIDIFKCKLCL